MNREELTGFVSEWIAAWDNRDIEAVLSHFSEHVTFTSPVAQAVTGSSTIEGKAALLDYWSRALSQRKSMVFTLDHWIWDEDRRELAIIYVRDADGERRRVCELLEFGEADLVVRGEAMHGVVLS